MILIILHNVVILIILLKIIILNLIYLLNESISSMSELKIEQTAKVCFVLINFDLNIFPFRKHTNAFSVERARYGAIWHCMVSWA